MNLKKIIVRCFAALTLAIVFGVFPACNSLERKYADSALLIVKAEIELRNKFTFFSSTPKFETLNIVHLPADEHEPFKHSHQEESYYIFADIPSGNYTVSTGYFQLVKYSAPQQQSGPTTVAQSGNASLSVTRPDAQDFELGVAVPWEDGNEKAAATEAQPDGIHYMGDYKIVMHFAGMASTNPVKTEITGEKTEAGERAAFQFILNEWPGSPWADLVRERMQ